MKLKCGLLGRAIKTARIEKLLTHEQLAEIINISPTHLKQLESERRNPSVEVLYKLAYTLNLSIDALFFPEKGDGQALLHKVRRRLNSCNQHELKILLATIEAMLDKKNN